MTETRLHAVAVLVGMAWLMGCGAGPSATAPAGFSDAMSSEAEWFVDRAEETGLHFVHFNGMTGRFYQPEIAAPGVGVLDYDNDGDLDVYLVQGELLDQGRPMVPPPPTLGDRLFRNDLTTDSEGRARLRFVDVTEASGLAEARGYGMGVATGDYDNDGWVDLYVTRFGRNQLFRNQGDGTFVAVATRAGVDDPAWGVSAAFVDYDRDGWLDLYVGNYMNYTLDTHTPCYFQAGPPDYCPPEVSPPQPDVLYRNQGDGSFDDVTSSAGLTAAFGPALGVATADYDNDGWTDLFVANDQQENQLWMNQGDGTFRDEALLRGVALGAEGEAKADMGVDAGDFDHDGDEDLFITELTGQGSTLYLNRGDGRFEDRSATLGIRGPSLPHTGFGAGWLDMDNDGWLDIVAVNGFVTQRLDVLGRDDPFPLQARNQLFRSLGTAVGRRFEEVTDRAGPAFTLEEVSRGAALGDIDNDGDMDVLIGNDAGPVRLLLNQIGSRQPWLGLRLVGVARRDMLGARVAILRSDGSTMWRRARADGSYASANDPRVLVGLGGASGGVERIRVHWPSGRIESWFDLPLSRYTTLVEGTGAAEGDLGRDDPDDPGT